MSLQEIPITDANVLSILSEVRKARGVHVYLDQPDQDSLKNKKYTALIDDLEKTGTAMVRYSVLLLVTEDAPVFSMGMQDHFNTWYAIEMGISSKFKAYGVVCDGNAWKNSSDILTNFKPKKDDYLIYSMTLKSPFGPNAGGNAPINHVQVAVNGHSSQKFNFSKDNLRHVARRLYYHVNFKGIQVLEHHLEYTGITGGLPIDTSVSYISLQFATISHLSAGGYAIIEGKYKEINSSLTGILIGVDKAGSPDFETFPNYNDPQELVTFVVSIGEDYCAVSSATAKTRFTRVQPGDDFVWLVVQNIDIENLEIHRGLKPAQL